MPANVAVPSPLSTKVTPDGSAPLSDSDAVGAALVSTVKLPAVFSSKVVVELEVIAGAAFTLSVKSCEASGLIPFVAVMVIG